MTIDDVIRHCDRRVKGCEMFYDTDSKVYQEHKLVAKCLRKLKHYEDLEAQGRLIELHCCVGDTVYTNVSMQGWYMHRKNRPYEAKVVFIGINGVNNFMNVELEEGKMLQFNFSDIGERVFLTKEAAEAALKECEKE